MFMPPSSASPRLTPFIYLLNGLLIGFVALFSWQSWRVAKDEQVRQLQTVLELSQKSLDRYFTQLETGLHGLSLDLAAVGGEADLPRVQALLSHFAQLHPENASINFARLDGQILASSRSLAGPLPNLAAEPSFKAFLAGLRPDTHMELGRPLFGAVSQEWIFPTRYVVRDPTGKPVGSLNASLPVALLQDFWSQAPMNDRILIGLLRDDGYLLSRYPLAPGSTLSNVYGEPRNGALQRYLLDQGRPLRGYVEGYNQQEGSNYGNAFARLEHYPVTVFVAVPTSQFALWRGRPHPSSFFAKPIGQVPARICALKNSRTATRCRSPKNRGPSAATAAHVPSARTAAAASERIIRCAAIRVTASGGRRRAPRPLQCPSP